MPRSREKVGGRFAVGIIACDGVGGGEDGPESCTTDFDNEMICLNMELNLSQTVESDEPELYCSSIMVCSRRWIWRILSPICSFVVRVEPRVCSKWSRAVDHLIRMVA